MPKVRGLFDFAVRPHVALRPCPSLDGKASGERGLETVAPSVGTFVFIAFTSLEPGEEGGAGGGGASAVAAVVVVVFRPLAVLSPVPEDEPEGEPEGEPEDEPGNELKDEPEDEPEDVIAFTSLEPEEEENKLSPRSLRPTKPEAHEA